MDLGDELVCRSCGVVRGKEVLETGVAKPPVAIDFTAQALGGYLGPPDTGFEERFTKSFAGSPSTYRYLKLVSDYSGREDSTVYGCAKLIERVSEKLELPGVVMAQAIVIAKALLGPKRSREDVSTAAVSAYSIVAACRIMGVTSASVREVVDAHCLLGRRVKVSSLIRLSLASPFRTSPVPPEEYVARVIGRLSSMSAASRSFSAAGLDPVAYFARLRGRAIDILEAIGETERGGHSPCSLAATAVYAAESELARSGARRRVLTQREIAEGGGIAEYTLRELYGRVFRQSTLKPAG